MFNNHKNNTCYNIKKYKVVNMVYGQQLNWVIYKKYEM